MVTQVEVHRELPKPQVGKVMAYSEMHRICSQCGWYPECCETCRLFKNVSLVPD